MSNEESKTVLVSLGEFLNANPDSAVTLFALAAICFVVWCMRNSGEKK
ncbi:hypothetical protein [Marinomonas communis]|uniref:Uncharacterized protein n=1 Tax=Marinomonas communis TaxID=28254 RepID=A0A4R6X0E7_9GAMM|nr:hypothetical protein [Marinomonas communis]TDR05449.1 hypothetical protein C8D85_3636 [Marinomonas communis]